MWWLMMIDDGLWLMIVIMIDLHDGGKDEDKGWQMMIMMSMMVVEDAGDNDGDDNRDW